MGKKVVGIYVIKCIANGKIYVGSSNDIQKRWSNHISLLKNNKHKNKEMQEDFNKFGWDRFSFRIKEECLIKDLYKIEDKYIKRYEAEELYNKRGILNTHKKIRRGRESAIHKQKFRTMFQGENNPHCTKFNAVLIKEIKQLLRAGVDMQEIAEKYNTTRGYIYAIASGRRWASVNIEED